MDLKLDWFSLQTSLPQNYERNWGHDQIVELLINICINSSVHCKQAQAMQNIFRPNLKYAGYLENINNLIYLCMLIIKCLKSALKLFIFFKGLLFGLMKETE